MGESTGDSVESAFSEVEDFHSLRVERSYEPRSERARRPHLPHAPARFHAMARGSPARLARLLDSLRGMKSRREPSRSGRGVGYCLNPACDKYRRGRVLAPETETFVCSQCGWSGRAQHERGYRHGEFGVVSEVRIEYGYDPTRDIYTRQAVVNEGRTLRRQDIYVLQTPMVEKEETALQVGRAILQHLNRRAFGPPKKSAA